MPTMKLRIRPVQSWTSGDELSLRDALGPLGYEPCPSSQSGDQIRYFQTEKLFPHNLWAESDDILSRLVPRLYCLFKFELTTESAKISRWTQVTGQSWFDPADECF